jgi:hypothetical protein
MSGWLGTPPVGVRKMETTTVAQEVAGLGTKTKQHQGVCDELGEAHLAKDAEIELRVITH